MRYIRYAFLAVIGIALITVALANRSAVTLTLLPAGVADIAGWNISYDLPLFLVILGGVAAGLLIGFCWEWLREHKFRADAVEKGRRVRRLEREVDELKEQTPGAKDDVLAILDKTG